MMSGGGRGGGRERSVEAPDEEVMLEPVGELAPELMRLVFEPCVSDPVPIDLLVIHLRAVECPMAVWSGGYLVQPCDGSGDFDGRVESARLRERGGGVIGRMDF